MSQLCTISSPIATARLSRTCLRNVSTHRHISREGIKSLWKTRAHCLKPCHADVSLATLEARRQLSSTARSNSEAKSFVYAISAAYSAKSKPLNPARNLYTHNPYHRRTKTATELSPTQRKQKRLQSGQDAFFVSNIGKTGGVAFGVADGVGGWEDSGIDSADFSHPLCDYMASAASSYPESFGNADRPLRPLDLLDLGYRKVIQDKSIYAGGSTACVATADVGGTLEVANLGDSGFAHLSPFRFKHVSAPQTHAFNSPFQLSKFPPKMLAQVALFGGGKPFAERPSDSQTSSHVLSHGDILLLATDGVWDNLSSQDILRIISRIMVRLDSWTLDADGVVGVSPRFSALAKKVDLELPSFPGSDGKEDTAVGLPGLLAMAIAREAKEASMSETRDGPFAKEVQRRHPREMWRGGKIDDICVVVAAATAQEEP